MRFKKFLLEYKEDLFKQCIVLMGLPASGKSTFIRDEIKSYFPNFINYKVVNSDIQVIRTQFAIAKSHFLYLQKYVTDEKEYKKFVEDTTYFSNDGRPISFTLTFEEMRNLLTQGFNKYFDTLFKKFYATYFDLRDLAKEISADLFQDKITKTTNMIVIDTVGSTSSKILDIFKDTRAENFMNNLIYLEINPELSIERDKWRKENYGRGVGESVIIQYVKNMDKAFDDYRKEGQKKDGLVDRLLHFRWNPEPGSVIKGKWDLIDNYKFYVDRKKS